nr:DUF1007 family protein [Paracoccus onubensis]
MFRPVLVATCLTFVPESLMAHPHIYIEASLDLIYNEKGELTSFGVEWAYDELYSLLIIEDFSFDQDGDGVLTPEENEMIQGFDADWEPDFDGRLYPSVDGQPVAMEPVRDFTAEYRDGRLVSYHLHPLSTPLPADKSLTIQVYDPEFYVHFTLPEPPEAKGRDDCEITLIPGDPNAAPAAYRQAVEALLGSNASNDDADLVTVDIGAAGADEARIRCGTGLAE